MNDESVQLLDELSRFSDPGAGPVTIDRVSGGLVIKMTRNGEPLILESDSFWTSKIRVRLNSGERLFDSYRALLASDIFANLSLWAARQRDVLSAKFPGESRQIPPHGVVQPGNKSVGSFLDVSNEIELLQSDNTAIQVFLIDGPAGVGKTNLIERLSLFAAQDFAKTGQRLFLHVLSRGKILSNIEDLMASSLQTLRLEVAFDQVPVLVKHGLITLAIDGFDELGDPEGYGHAWGQMNDLINFVRGDGLLVLAGRETFIGRERLIRFVPALSQHASVMELVLEETPPHAAEQWLREQQVDNKAIEALEGAGLLDRGSFALRPFFLSYLARDIQQGGEWVEEYSRLSDVLPIVVSGMVDREVRRFHGEVSSVLGEAGVRKFIVQFLAEVAREMAGDQSESIADTMISWLVELSLPSEIDASILSLLKARAPAMAFLALDDRVGFRRFGHSQFFNFFLSRSTLDSVKAGDVPKWLRRGAVGADFLVAFVPFLRFESAHDSAALTEFLEELFVLAAATSVSGESVQLAKNVAGLAFSTMSLSSDERKSHICAAEIQYAYAGSGTFVGEVNVDFIHVLDVRNCDLERVSFAQTQVNTVFVDAVTRFGVLPRVQAMRIQAEDGSSRDAFDPAEVASLLSKLSRSAVPLEGQGPSEALTLLDKLCRSRRYWFKAEGDDLFGDFSQIAGWQALKAALESNSLIREDSKRQASGASADWFHIKNSRAILLRDISDEKVKCLLHEVGWRNRDGGS